MGPPHYYYHTLTSLPGYYHSLTRILPHADITARLYPHTGKNITSHCQCFNAFTTHWQKYYHTLSSLLGFNHTLAKILHHTVNAFMLLSLTGKILPQADISLLSYYHTLAKNKSTLCHHCYAISTHWQKYYHTLSWYNHTLDTAAIILPHTLITI